MKLSLLCQHQGLFPTVITVGPRFEQRFEPAMACHASCFPLPHRDLLLTIMSFTISFFLIGNQRYPPHLWLILGLANGYLMVRGWQGWSLQQFKDLFDAKPEEQWVKSSRLQPALPHRSCILILPHCQSSSSTDTELMTQCWCKSTSLEHLFDTGQL